MLNLQNLLPGRLQSWLEAVLSFSVLSPDCSLASYHYFTLVTVEKRKLVVYNGSERKYLKLA